MNWRFSATKEPAPAASSTSSACPSASATSPQHLYGLWQVQWGDASAPAQLQLGRHPEFAESVRGSLHRASQLAQVVGDLEDGELAWMLKQLADQMNYYMYAEPLK